jgi:ribosomal protein L22, bacterial type
MEAKAYVKGVRIAPRKVRLVLDLVRGKDVKEAEAILKFTPKGASPVIAKALKSAVANALNNNNMEETKLYISECYADEGQTLKRWMPRAKGSASQILKRTSHITVVVAERE